ncbi:unnamed protein product [Effrenium voratum]|nr:unnamed protein product [Effrenium voratum]
MAELRTEPEPEVPEVKEEVPAAPLPPASPVKILEGAKAKAAEVAELAAGKVQAAKAQTSESVTLVMTKAAEMRESAHTKAEEATGAVQQRWQQLKAVAGASYKSLREEGPKAWVFQNYQSARQFTVSQLTKSLDASKSLALSVRAKVHSKVQDAAEKVKARYAAGKTQTAQAVENAKAKVSKAQLKAKEVVQDKHVQATAAGAVGGAATLGATGGATGLAAGGVAGAALGVIPALFTFGLSIPVGAAIGGTAGLAVGASVGAAAGAASGGAAGFQAYAKREQIGEFRQSTLNKVNTGVDAVKGKAVASAQFLKDKASAARVRLSGKAAKAA